MSITPENPGDERRVAFVQSSWHPEIVAHCREAFVASMMALGYDSTQVDVFDVPGVFEIPLQAKLLASTGRYAAVIAAGMITDEGGYRQEIVADAVINGLMRVQLDSLIPVISAVFSPRTHPKTEQDQAAINAYFAVKGGESASACHQSMENVSKVLRTGARGGSRAG
jgi:6,7-dimethyl-8-ribityllumazine synthase